MTYISILLHDYIRYVWSLEVLDALSEHKPCLNTMFKQAATERCFSCESVIRI